jgi:hypothetical protein
VSTLGRVVARLRASGDELHRVSGHGVQVQQRLGVACEMLLDVADGTSDSKPVQAQHRFADARERAGEAARLVLTGVRALEEYIAEIAPDLAGASSSDELDLPVTGEELLTPDPPRPRRRLSGDLIQNADKIKDVGEFVAERGQALQDFSRLPDGPSPAQAHPSVPDTRVPVVSAADSRMSYTDVVGTVVMSVAFVIAASRILADRVIAAWKGHQHAR